MDMFRTFYPIALLFATGFFLSECAAQQEQEPQATPTIEDLLLFFPTKYPRGSWNPKNLEFEDVEFKSADKTNLHGWFIAHENPVATVLYLHGNAGNLSDRHSALKHLNENQRLEIFIFDYRGYGKSEGKATTKGALMDSKAALKTLMEKTGKESKDIVLLGRSLGGSMAVPLAVEFKTKGLILESTFPSLRQVAKVHFEKLAWLVSKKKLNSKTAIKDYHGPVLQSHGTADRVIPFDLGKELFESANKPKQFITIKHGRHNDRPSTQYYTAMEKFFAELNSKD